MGTVTVAAPSRLHFGLLVESDGFDRVDGGVGVALSKPSLRVKVSLSSLEARWQRDGTQRVAPKWLRSLSDLLSVGVEVSVLRSIPKHVGLGSETALRMAVARGAAALVKSHASTEDLARAVGRGGTSGIGVHAGAVGGFLADHGHSWGDEKKAFGPSSATLAGPAKLRMSSAATLDQWRIVHLRPKHIKGISGAEEASFFASHCPVPRSETERILAVVEKTLLPAIHSGTLIDVNVALAELQRLGLKAREWAIQPSIIHDLRRRWPLRVPLGLSSMGPTVFAIVSSQDLELALERIGSWRSHFVITVSGVSSGTRIEGHNETAVSIRGSE